MLNHELWLRRCRSNHLKSVWEWQKIACFFSPREAFIEDPVGRIDKPGNFSFLLECHDGHRTVSDLGSDSAASLAGGPMGLQKSRRGLVRIFSPEKLLGDLLKRVPIAPFLFFPDKKKPMRPITKITIPGQYKAGIKFHMLFSIIGKHQID
jgi:hypothetical protein